jgi:hypothetical protein
MSSSIFRNWAIGSVAALAAYAAPTYAQVAISKTDVSCNGGSNGSATVQSAIGVMPPYQYSWAPTGGTAATASGLQAGQYTVTVSSIPMLGNSDIGTVTISQPPVLSAAPTSQTNPAGPTPTGSATVGATGGTAPYTYSWSPTGGTAATATGLTAGIYTVWVTDNNGCATSQSFTLTEEAAAPGAPTIGTATAGDGQATVAFTPPAPNGSAPITGYTVTATPVAVPGAPAVTTQTGAASPIIVTGLTNGFTYDFSVVATNGTPGAASANAQATPRKLELSSAPGSVPGMSGAPSATMSGGGATCTLQPGGGFGPAASTPPNLQAPNGQFAFSAANCTGSVTMTLTYPSPLPQGVQFRKPDGAGGWFDPMNPATSLNVIVNGARTTVTYTITDNGPGDTNPAVGAISDPLVPVLAAAGPGGTAAIPTLSEWGVILMSALLAMFGLRRMRRRN